MTPAAQQLALDHLAFARRIADKISRSRALPLSIDDLYGAAYLGLCRAAARYRESFGVPFKAWAPRYIYGEIIDECRELHHLHRVGTYHKSVDPRSPISNNIQDRAALFGLDPGALDDLGDCDLEAIDPADWAEAWEPIKRAWGRIETPRDRYAAQQYLFFDRPQREIAEELHIDVSRVCQIVRDARQKITEEMLDVELETILLAAA
jgi:RNA polymerase sigma factor (sigma-70 family)